MNTQFHNNSSQRVDYEKILPFMPRRHQLMVQLMFACGLTSVQVCQLRLRDIDWERQEIIVRSKDGVHEMTRMPIPEALREPLKINCLQVKSLYRSDKPNGWVQTQIPRALHHLKQALGTRQEWQFLFPASTAQHSFAAAVLRRSPMPCAALNNEIARAAKLAKLNRAQLKLKVPTAYKPSNSQTDHAQRARQIAQMELFASHRCA